jgi:hypothetical protein
MQCEAHLGHTKLGLISLSPLIYFFPLEVAERNLRQRSPCLVHALLPLLNSLE